jgi:hypothetical protein
MKIEAQRRPLYVDQSRLKQQVLRQPKGTGEAVLALRHSKSEAEIELPVPPIASAI